MKDITERLLIAFTGAFFVFGGSAANAITIIDPDMKLNVTYTGGSIISGPLSFGLPALPVNVNATFLLGPGDDNGAGSIMYDIGDVASAEVTFGDGTWNALASFDLEVENGIVESLDYQFFAIDTTTTQGPIVLNFPLTITGTDRASGDDFQYGYTESTQSISSIPEPTTLALMGLGLAGIGCRRQRSKKVT